MLCGGGFSENDAARLCVRLGLRFFQFLLEQKQNAIRKFLMTFVHFGLDYLDYDEI